MAVSNGRLQEVNVRLIVVIGLISMLLLVVIALGAHAWLRYEQYAQYQERIAEARYPEHDRLVEAQRERIETYRWVDEEQGRVAIPVERAMERIMVDYPQSNAQ